MIINVFAPNNRAKKKGKLTKLKGEIKFNNYSCNNDLSVNNIKN